MSNESLRKKQQKDLQHEGRDKYDIDVDRMVNEGLGGGRTEVPTGEIGQTTTNEIRKKENES